MVVVWPEKNAQEEKNKKSGKKCGGRALLRISTGPDPATTTTTTKGKKAATATVVLPLLNYKEKGKGVGKCDRLIIVAFIYPGSFAIKEREIVN